MSAAGRGTWWLIFAGCSALVIAALAWVTVETIRLERAECAAQARADREEAQRLALWRMDAWFGPLLRQEGSRQYFDYQSFYEPPSAYTNLFQPVREGVLTTPSPLLSFRSEYIVLHFQAGPGPRLTSPRVPESNQRDFAEGMLVSADEISAASALLDDVRTAVAPLDLLRAVTEVEVTYCAAISTSPIDKPAPAQQLAAPVQQSKSWTELTKRQAAYVLNNSATGDGGDAVVSVGPLVPFWAPAEASDAEPKLLFLRRLRAQDGEAVQGFLCDWPRIRAALLAEVADLMPAATLTPIALDAIGGGQMVNALTTIPVVLDGGAAAPITVALVTPTRLTLAVTWLAVLAALLTVAVTLQASVRYGESRSRFASAVTHELRTPLTTFRMYTEMLASGMVDSEEKRREYLVTLRDESDRLARLVENVLAYARLERGENDAAGRPERRAVTLEGLIDRIIPTLRPVLDKAAMELEIDVTAPAEPLLVDAEAVGQIVFNLVENACKYAGGSGSGAIKLRAAEEGGRLVIDVRDGGPGIPAEHARSIFSPFDRGALGPGDTTPGLGLGLALCRGLARRLGGDLHLVASGAGREGGRERGACFRLAVPAR